VLTLEDYLTKYIAEQKENKKIDSTAQLLEPAVTNSLSQDVPAPPPTQTNTSNEAAKKSAELVAAKLGGVKTAEAAQKEAAIAKMSDQLTGEDKSTFLKSQEKLMMGLYNQYYAQYMQQYQQQQQEAHELAQMAIELEKRKSDPEATEGEVDQAQSK